MKKTLITILTTSFISFQLESNEIYKTNNESVYLNLLSRFDIYFEQQVHSQQSQQSHMLAVYII